MLKIFELYSDTERKVLDFATYCAAFITLVFLLLNIRPSYVQLVKSNQFLYSTTMILFCISMLGAAYLDVRMLYHCAGSKDIRWYVRIVMLPVLLGLMWIAAVFYYRGIYLTPPTPRYSALGHGRGLSEDIA